MRKQLRVRNQAGNVGDIVPGVPNRYPRTAPGTSGSFIGGGAGIGFMSSNRMGYGNYGASQSKIANQAWRAASGSADDDILYNLPLLRVRSRDLFMGSPIAGAAILTLADNVIGNGLTHIPQIDGEELDMSSDEAEEYNELIKKEFNLFADTVECDWNRRSTFFELTRLAFINMAISGDVLGLLPMKERPGSIYETKIRLMEADRVASYRDATMWYNMTMAMNGNKNGNGEVDTYGGVELDDDGEVVAYWIAPSHPMMMFGATPIIPFEEEEFIRIPAFGEETGRPSALLVAEMERPEQRRGVPFMAKCLTECKQVQRYIESTTIQNVIKSYFTAFVESAMPSSEMFDRLVSDDDIDDLVFRNPYDVRLGPAIINWMRPGDKITFPVGAGPEQGFEGYVVAMCKFIGSCMGIPFEILLKHFSASYSASRGSKLEFWKRILVLRGTMGSQWCQPIYNAWMMEAIAKGVWNAPGFFENPRIFKAWTNCGWVGASMGSIDPLKEIDASRWRIKLGVSTTEQECLEINGSDWKANALQQHAEGVFNTQLGLTYIRNLDNSGLPIMSYGVSEQWLTEEQQEELYPTEPVTATATTEGEQ